MYFQFAVHLGVARGSSGIILEQTGKNEGYRDRDVCGFHPQGLCCVEGGAEILDSVINMRTIWKKLKQAGVDVLYSRDAGRYVGGPMLHLRTLEKTQKPMSSLLLRYLCDFAYYCSLYHGERRAALIHLPSSGYLALADRLVPLLQTLLQTMLVQLEDLPATDSQTSQPPQVRGSFRNKDS